MASFHSNERIAPSKRGIKHIVRQGGHFLRYGSTMTAHRTAPRALPAALLNRSIASRLAVTNVSAATIERSAAGLALCINRLRKEIPSQPIGADTMRGRRSVDTVAASTAAVAKAAIVPADFSAICSSVDPRSAGRSEPSAVHGGRGTMVELA